MLDHDVALVGVGGRDGFAVDPLALFGEPLEKARAIGDLTTRLGQRLALLCRHDPRQIVAVLVQQRKPLQQHGAALLGGLGAPDRPGFVGGHDGLVAFHRTQVGHLGQHQPGGRVGDGKAAAAADPFATDQRIGLQQARVVER